MPPEELANHVEDAIRTATLGMDHDTVKQVIAECRERAEGVGAQQYYKPGEPQRFESMSVDSLFEYTEEELRDAINYYAMLKLRPELKGYIDGHATKCIRTLVSLRATTREYRETMNRMVP